jgi:very-short-patch-repair endonuclease
MATAEAANPFESALRGIAVDVDGLNVRPQVSIYDPHFLGRPDLVDERLGIILEADSFEWHGSRAALQRDARRYDVFVVRGWLVLRFAWEDVMFDQTWVRSILEAAVAQQADRRCVGCRAA